MRSAFTMVELLVVIAIILVLVAILIPVIGIIREQAKMAVTEQRIMRIDQAFTQLALGKSDVPQLLQEQCGLPGVIKMFPKNFTQLNLESANHPTRRNFFYLAGNYPAAELAKLQPIGAWLTAADFAKPHIFGFPWSEPDRIGMSGDAVSAIIITNPGANYTQNDGEVLVTITGSGSGATAVADMNPPGPPRYVGIITVTNGGRGYRNPVTVSITPPNAHDPMATTTPATAVAVLGPEDAPLDEQGLQVVGLHQLDPSLSAELIAASGIIENVADPAEARTLYRTSRATSQPFNDAWGNPLVASWGLFQPAGDRYLIGGTAYYDSRMFQDARKVYGYQRAVYLTIGAIGPKLPDPLTAEVLATTTDQPTWTGTILPTLWTSIASTCQAQEWVGASFQRPPWTGPRRKRANGLWSTLASPRELKSP